MITIEVQLSDEQVQALDRIAEEEGLSMVEVILRSVDEYVQDHDRIGTEEQRRRALAVAGKYHSGLTDVGRNHDKYLADIYSETAT